MLFPTRWQRRCLAPSAQTRALRLLRSRILAEGADDAEGSASGILKARRRGRYPLIVVGVVSILLLGLLFYSLGDFSGSGPSSSATTTSFSSTSYDITAASLVGTVASHPPDAYVETSSKQLNPNESGLASGGYGFFSTQAGDLANVTILVFDGQQAAQNYTDSVIGNTKHLSGYTDVTGVLTNYDHYGACYGVGETDPEGNGAIAQGICSKGNVYIWVHVVSSASLPVAEGEMADLVGAAYQSLG
jgi:hypothetical protein